ncbi:MAG: GtrA family protein [Oscillospiraceae bacterium]|nr:GtrA family protein [Oscillospiraceae bacterium]
MLEALLQFVLKFLPKPLKKIWDKYESVWRYCYYGAWTTVVSIITKLVGKWIFGLMGLPLSVYPIPNAINTTISWIITVTFAFFVNKKYVFHSEATEKQTVFREVLTFYGARFVTFFLELGLMELPVLFKWGDVGYIIMTIASQFIILAINYVFSKLVVFKKGAEQSK